MTLAEEIVLSSDENFARVHCLTQGMHYLSHETYRTQTSHQVWIAVEQDGERFEVKLSR